MIDLGTIVKLTRGAAESARTKNPLGGNKSCRKSSKALTISLPGCRLTLLIMAPSFDTLTEQDLHEEEEEEIDFSGACTTFDDSASLTMARQISRRNTK